MTAFTALCQTLRVQASICGQMGSPFYEGLLGRIAEDLDAGGPTRGLLGRWAETRAGQLYRQGAPIRVGNTFNHLAMSGEAGDLAAAWPRPGAAADPDRAWAQARAAIGPHFATLSAFLAHEPQTNEVRRSAVLLAGFLTVAAETGLPLRCFEVGASAGLNVLWDRFRYRLGEAEWGDPASPVEVPADWTGPLPPLTARIEVLERAACDRRPTDLADAAQRRRLLANIWPDQFHRIARSERAIAVALAEGVTVDEADAVAWARERVAPRPGAATVLYHSIFWQYLDAATLQGLKDTVAALGASASPDAPFAWLRMEPPIDNLAMTELRLTLWPGGEERRLAEVSPHGAWVRWTQGAPADCAGKERAESAISTSQS